MNDKNRTEYPQLQLDGQLCFPLYACARKVIGAYTPLLKPLGLTYTQYIVMLELWEKEKEKVGELCHRLYLDCGTITPMLKKMEQAGYIERRRCRDDDRIVEITLTDAGRDLQDKVKDVPVKVSECISLPQDKAQELYALLYELLGNQRKHNDTITEGEKE
jgi:DNA-binding MarR family transcriptional regulator